MLHNLKGTSKIEAKEMASESSHTIDNRVKTYDQNSMWGKLNLSQRYSASSLGQFGYTLSHVRTFGQSTMAIMKQNDKMATINNLGAINTNPGVKRRA